MKLKTFNSKLIVTTLTASSIIASCSSYAASGEFPVTASIVADMAINEIVKMNIKQNVLGIANSECVLAVTVYPTASTVMADKKAAVKDGLSGTGCVTVAQSLTSNFAGIYEIKGQFSQQITVTVSTATNSDFTFAPSGRVNGTTADMTVGTAISADTATISTLDAAGSATVILGGTFTIGAGTLTPEDGYSQTFNITAVY